MAALVFFVDTARVKDSDQATFNTITRSYNFYPRANPRAAWRNTRARSTRTTQGTDMAKRCRRKATGCDDVKPDAEDRQLADRAMPSQHTIQK